MPVGSSATHSGIDIDTGPTPLPAGMAEPTFATPLSHGSSTNRTHDSVLNPPFEADMQLTWPDSEDLLQTILSSDLSTWAMPLDILPFPQYSPINVSTAQNVVEFPGTHDPSMDGGGQAVRHLSQMITSLVSSQEAMPTPLKSVGL